MSEIEYVIYCRKSTDENSGKQTQSIPDQIKRCMEYAKSNGLTIKKKPLDFSAFETDREIFEEENDRELQNREIYKESRWFFIVKEQQSGKIPHARAKRKKLIKMVNDGKIKGLLSYSPDRQARNIIEWWELIDLVDQWKITLKYTNFHFEPDASWKMMLWIWFVFSKQYSDKLSEDVRRGNKSAHSKGKATGVSKYWYTIDKETKLHKPDPQNFELMRKAFEMKIYEKKSDKQIIQRLKGRGFQREKNKNKLSETTINKVWKDPFYYGMFQKWDDVVDLREVSESYKEMISEDEYNILRERYNNKKKLDTIKKKKSEYDCISPIPEWMMILQEEGFKFTRYIPNPLRRKKKLEELQKTNPKATYASIIKPNQIYYTMKSRFAEKSIDIRFSEVNELIIKKLDSLCVNETSYQTYVEYLTKELDKIESSRKKEREVFLLQINKLTSERNVFIKKNLWNERSVDEEKVYQTTLAEFDRDIEAVNIEASKIVGEERNQIAEFEVMVDVIRKWGKYYKKANYVQKAVIIDIFFSNILVDKEKRLTLEVKPWLEELFSEKNLVWLTCPKWSWTSLYNFIANSKLEFAKKLLWWYLTDFNPQSKLILKLSKKQIMLYELEEFWKEISHRWCIKEKRNEH